MMLPRPRALVLVAAMIAATSLGLSGALPAGAATDDPRPGPAATPSAMPAAGTFYPSAPVRVLGTPTGGYAVALGSPGSPGSPGSVVSVTTAGRSGLPSSGVSALMVNVVTTAGASDVRLGLTAAGGVSPAPLLEVPAGTTRSTLVTVPLATTPGFDVSATGGAATVTVDVLGFYAADDTVVAGYGLSGGYQPVETTPLFESSADGAIPPGGRALLAVDLGGPATAHTTALLVHVTSKDTTAPGSLSVSAASAPVDPDGVLPATVSFAAGAPAGNLALVPAEVDSSGRLGIAVTNRSAAPAGYALDLVGFYDDGGIGPNLRFRAVPQTRVIDTATGLGGVSALAPDAGGRTTLGDAVADDSTFAVAGVLTTTTSAASAASAVTVLTPDAVITSSGGAPVAAGATSVAVQSEVGAGRDLAVLAGPGSAPMGLTLDVVGTFEAHPPVTNPAARRWVPPVSPWQITAVPRSS